MTPLLVLLAGCYSRTVECSVAESVDELEHRCLGIEPFDRACGWHRDANRCGRRAGRTAINTLSSMSCEEFEEEFDSDVLQVPEYTSFRATCPPDPCDEDTGIC